MKTKFKTQRDALDTLPDGYSQAELQLIWEGSDQPIREIRALVDVSKGEAMRLWNARKLPAVMLLLGLLVAGCQTAASNPPAATSALSDDELFARARAALFAKLKDPESAKLTNVHRVGDYVCGSVNAKNSYGGYTGTHTFSVSLDGEALIGGESVDLGVWASPCWNDPRRTY